MKDFKLVLLFCNKGPYPVILPPNEVAEFLAWCKANIGKLPVKDEQYNRFWVTDIFFRQPKSDLFDGWIIEKFDEEIDDVD